jgi:UDP-N-acetylglucosamine--N-acetylmuramyl-(pentapeptide) pyrophosphoryl-undecaprenol N-acetylglucosamine transferase
MTKEKIIIATGGTGGHIFPAYSLAKYLIDKNFNVKLTTDKRGFKYLENYKNLDLNIIPSSPLVRKNFFRFMFSILIIIYSIIKSVFFLILYRPSIIFGMGGYSSFPICIAAFFLRIKFIVYENNLIIGKANKYLLPFTKKIFVSYKELEGIPKKFNDKIIEVGNLVREEIINSNYNNQENKIEKLKILVMGGSQGAKIFAEELPPVFKKLNNLGLNLKIYQQCQKEQTKFLSEFYKNSNIDYEVFNFTNNITNYYSKTNLVVTRSGASVLGELINIKVPFISIPLPTSADNHQLKNAEFYEKKGYGYLLNERDINKKLFSLINSILKDKSSIKKILFNQRQYSDKDIFKNLKILIEKVLNEKN